MEIPPRHVGVGWLPSNGEMVLLIERVMRQPSISAGSWSVGIPTGGLELCPNTGEYNEHGFGNGGLSKIAGAICTTRVLQPQQVMKGAPSELK